VLLSFAAAIILDYELLDASRSRWRDETARGFNNLALSLERMVGRDVGDLDRLRVSPMQELQRPAMKADRWRSCPTTGCAPPGCRAN
jgi:hypothetical protein